MRTVPVPCAILRQASHSLCLLLALTLQVAAAQTAGDMPDAAASPVWRKVSASLFAGKELHAVGEDLLRLEIAARAEDASTVPVAIRSAIPMAAARHIDKLYLIVDNNPSPVAAVFSLHPRAGRVELETRIRVESYTHVRAVALMNDGSAMMAVKYVKAAGGCSAPAGRDAERAQANLGKMRLALPQGLLQGRPSLVQLMVSHPNESGLAMDQLTRLYPPAYYVRSLAVSLGGEPVLSAELDFSISENPHFRFYVDGTGTLQATVSDTQDKVFRTALELADSRP